MSAGFATMSVASILVETARRMPERVALVVGPTETTYAELWQQTREYAGALRERGVKPGTPVAMLIPNVADFPRVYYAVLSLGGVVVPIHALLKGKEIEYVLRDSGAELLVCAAPLLTEGAKGAALAGVPVLSVLLPDAAPELPPRLEDEARSAQPIETYVPRDPFDTATILYTSGTTGTPKGAEGSHLALVEQVNVSLLTTFDMKEGDRVLGALPLFHTFGQTCTMNTVFRAGATLVMVPKFDGDTALRVMNEQRCTIFMGVPTMYIALLDAASRTPERPPLRYGISGGAAIPVAVITKFRESFGTEIHEGYGLTETSPVATFNMVGVPPRPGTIGTPIWGIDVEIADSEVSDSIVLLPTGELGELVIRGHNLMNGYHNRPEDTAKAMVDGWFRTGDLGRKDHDGYLTIVDRTKDMILRNGYNVYPREVEEVLAKHPAVSMVAVYGVPHETHGQEIIASVVLVAGASTSPDELSAFVQEDVAHYKYPRHIDIVSSLPIGPSGKVLKRELVAAYVAAADQPAEPAPIRS
ncbi:MULTISPECIES: long-chain-fatty-acid--CoA ligase [Subtercola]|uniref:Long-chain fatty acid--CoA ligase n=1 Tax=Subtercola vilae TaxID=2056433 RepID=A0A4T2BX56_9MICO|nr:MULTISPECIES: long-chain fatty acid--CoA ligase [Subtercola]MEA9985585.1 long-chain fatty acid--CoA ligase [Subtercola sp. RTI3]TIH36335.1 long-chain fatty acid--CoA ligase [Subtercola vilae]